MQVIINKLREHFINFNPYFLKICILEAFDFMMLLQKIDKFITMVPKLDNIPFQFKHLLLGEPLDPRQQVPVDHHLAIVQIEQLVQYMQDDMVNNPRLSPLHHLPLLRIARMLQTVNQLKNSHEEYLYTPDLPQNDGRPQFGHV